MRQTTRLEIGGNEDEQQHGEREEDQPGDVTERAQQQDRDAGNDERNEDDEGEVGLAPA